MNSAALDYIQSLVAHDHAIYLYGNAEEKWRVISKHLAEALDVGGAGFYVCYFENPEHVRRTLTDYGIDTDRYERHNRLRILEFGDHVKNERFDTMASELTAVYDKLAGKGGAMRAAGDSTLTVKNGYVAQLFKYEGGLGKTVNLPVAGICAYEMETLMEATELLPELIELHGHAIFPGMALKLE